MVCTHWLFFSCWLPMSIALYTPVLRSFRRVDRLLQSRSAVQLKAIPRKSNASGQQFAHSNHGDAENSDQRFCLTTPIYYVNGEPHLGHAYTSVISDIIARYHRKDGKDVYFLSGTDEHGQKVEQSARNSQKTPLAFADEVSQKFRHLMTEFHCTNDDFIRTTEERHKRGVEYLWKALEENNQIYLGAYEGWYSIRDEAFYQETELVDGKAPTGAEVTWVKEESYFFRLSAWTEKLLAYYEENPDFISPKGRRNEVVSFLSQEGGLKDLSISRTTFSWGIPVPGNPKHVIYVWLDALVNYISALGYPDLDSPLYKRFWPANVHIVGKDILRFHTLYWPAFLMAAKLPLPKKVFAHGWWTRDGEKMSKSLGNVIEPHALLRQYGVDYCRYFMASEIHFGNDGDFSHESFAHKINAELANDFGNLLMRVLVLTQKYCENRIPVPGPFTAEDEALLEEARQTLPSLRTQLEELNIKSMVDLILHIPKQGNRYIYLQAPWELAKTDPARMRTVLYVLAEVMRLTAIYLEPVVPLSCQRLFKDLGIPEEYQSFDSVNTPMPPGFTVVDKATPLFPRIELLTDAVHKEEKKTKKNGSATKSPSSVVDATVLAKYAGMDLSQLATSITTVGDLIRQKKAEKADKDAISPLVSELKLLKERYKSLNNGVEYAPSAVQK